MFKNIFKKSDRVVDKLVEPIFPIGNFSAGKVEFEEGVGFVIVNTAYYNYPNKKFFP